jgi:hypothetical protein
MVGGGIVIQSPMEMASGGIRFGQFESLIFARLFPPAARTRYWLSAVLMQLYNLRAAHHSFCCCMQKAPSELRPRFDRHGITLPALPNVVMAYATGISTRR